MGVVLELPDPITIVIVGLIDAGLPAENEALIELHVEVLGVIDFGTQTLAIDGSLYNSSVLIYALAGDMAFRLSWGATSNFVFSWGGLNPNFNTAGLNLPANMHRMSVSIGKGDNPRISSNSYFAVTSNSVQFGANVQAYAAAGGFSVSGYLGFDVLIIISPFSFEFDFSASFDVGYDGATLVGLNVDGTFSGPTPWHFHGSASISLLFFSVGVSVDLTWGSSAQATIPQQPVLPDLFKALQNPASWNAALPSGTGPTVTLSTPSPGNQTLLVHPMGTLTVKENIVPLDLQITRYGNAAPSDGTEFSISSVQINGATESIQTVQDYFAPGQFLNLSDADKLSDPSFEMYDAGVTIGSACRAERADHHTRGQLRRDLHRRPQQSFAIFADLPDAREYSLGFEPAGRGLGLRGQEHRTGEIPRSPNRYTYLDGNRAICRDQRHRPERAQRHRFGEWFHLLSGARRARYLSRCESGRVSQSANHAASRGARMSSAPVTRSVSVSRLGAPWHRCRHCESG